MTRANIIIRKDERDIYLYRHCDGYPEGLGSELEEAIDTNSQIDTILNILEIPGIEITNSIHGDIEYLYTITLHKYFTLLSCQKL